MEGVVVAASHAAAPWSMSPTRPLLFVVSASKMTGRKSNISWSHPFLSARSTLKNRRVRRNNLIHDVSLDQFFSCFQCLAWISEERTRCYETFKDFDESLPCSSFQTTQGVGLVAYTCITKLSSLGNPLRRGIKILKEIGWQDILKKNMFTVSIQLVLGMMLVMAVSTTFNKSQSWALTEENLLFLEAWRTVDRAYVDKTFNGQSWFRYRENALRNEPMNTRKETYFVSSLTTRKNKLAVFILSQVLGLPPNGSIKKMLSTLDDPFTRFLEPEKFKNLRSGTQGALTGVGLSIGYPLALDGSAAGLIVVSSSPEGPAEKAGILPGDLILEIDDTSTEDMDIYDAAERLQGSEGSMVKLSIRSGSEIKNLVLRREKVTLNPVKSRICEITVSGSKSSKIGYIKLTSFNQNASGAVKNAIESLRSSGVEAFVLDLRNNSGGLFPEGIEIAKIWMDKGVIVYICDNRGVRDIYEADGTNTIAASEPLAVLVNKGTASASEILAGALKDNKRAVLYGEPTFGKGKIQSVFELSDGSGLIVTVARYETPGHTNIDKVGIIPDHPLPMPFPVDGDGFCNCLKDSASPCSLNTAQLLSR